MENQKQEKTIIRNFGLTSLSLNNRNTVFLLTLVLSVFGLVSYLRMPKELFPDIVIPTVLVQTPYPGNSPADIENLITRPLEKEIEGVHGIKTLSSNSKQDISMITVEFNTGVDLDKALKDVKDAVDRAKSDLPDDLLSDPVVFDIDLTEFPILTINLSGDYSILELRNFAEYLQDEIETVSEMAFTLGIEFPLKENIGLLISSLEYGIRGDKDKNGWDETYMALGLSLVGKIR